MVEGITFYALKADDFCLFIGLPDEIKKSYLI